MQKSNVTSFLRVVLKKLARKLVGKKVKKFAFDHCKTCSERFVISEGIIFLSYFKEKNYN